MWPNDILQLSGPIQRLRISVDGKWMAVIYYPNQTQGAIAVFRNLQNRWEPIYSADFPISIREARSIRSVRYGLGLITDCAFHPTLPLFAYVAYQGQLTLLDLHTGTIRHLPLSAYAYDTVRFIEGDRLILTTLGGTPDRFGMYSGDATLIIDSQWTVIDRIWRCNRCIDALPGDHVLLLGETGQNAGFLRFVRCGPDGKWTGYDYAIGLTEGFCDVRVSPSGRFVAVLGKTSCPFFCLFDLVTKTCSCRLTWPLHLLPTSFMWMFPNGAVFLRQETQILLPNYVDGDPGLVTIDVTTGQMRKANFGHQYPVNAVDISQQTGLLISGDLNGGIATTNLESLGLHTPSIGEHRVTDIPGMKSVDCHGNPTERNVQWITIPTDEE